MANSKKVTMSDVAKAAGVSQATVSMIFSNKDSYKFSSETIDSVKSIAHKLGYNFRKEPVKNDLNSKIILAVFPDMTNPYYAMLYEAVQASCIAKGYNVLSFTTSRNLIEESRIFDLLDNLNLAGIVFSYCPTSDTILKKLSKIIPTVLIIGDKDESLDIDSIALNSEKSGRIIATHLLSLGHQKIAFITTKDSRVGRLRGIQECFERKGLFNSIIIKAYDPSSCSEKQSPYMIGFSQTKELLVENNDITAIVGISDMYAVGIIDALYDEQFCVPDDFSVVGFDNILYSATKRISLTTVDHYVNAKGNQAVELLCQKIEKAISNILIPSTIMHVEYEPRLIVRNSTGPVKQLKS